MVKVLIISVHPDDELLGCGGTITHHADAGDRVQVLIVGDRSTSRQKTRVWVKAHKDFTELNKAVHIAGLILGAAGVELLDLLNNLLGSIDHLDLIKHIESSICRHQPEVVYVHRTSDVNVDHRLLHEAVVTASRPMPGQTVNCPNSLEVSSGSEWQTPGSAPLCQPKWFVDISVQMHLKRESLTAYASEMRPWPHARSLEGIEHLARWRGAQVGVRAAEAFCLLRQVG